MKRRGATVLIVLGCLLVPVADVAIWTRRVILDSERFAALADDLLDREEVRAALAAEIVEELEQARPGVTRFGLVLDTAIRELLKTSIFRTVFGTSVRVVHGSLVHDGDALALDLDPALRLVRDAVAVAAPDRVDEVPTEEEFGEIVIVRRDQAPYLWAGVDAARWASAATIVAAAALLGLGIAGARRRAVALAGTGAGVAVASLALVPVVAGVQAAVSRLWVPGEVDRAAFNAVWDVFERSLLTQSFLVALVGVAAAAAGLLAHAGSTGGLDRSS